jgi:FkbM family methyltransferase
MAKLQVMTEDETLDALLAGKSIARFGDGEFKLALGRGRGLKQQLNSPELKARLLEILECKGDYIVAIPRLNKANPKNQFWRDLFPRVEHLFRTDYVYGSSLISRPDNAPWIDNAAYYAKIEQLWANKHTVFVWGGSRKSFTPSQFRNTKSFESIQSLPEQAWKDVPNILARLDTLPQKPDVVILALGPTATAIIPDIVARGIQGIDIGHLGGWMRTYMKETRKFESVDDFEWPSKESKAYGDRYVYRTRDLDYAINKCTKRRSVVQAGGHVGVWPKFLGRFFGQVYTFEPELQNFLALNKNCPESHIYRFQAALGDVHQPVDLTLHPNNIGGHHVNGGEGWIPQFKIDDLGLKDCDLIVLDVEGSELAALRGAVATLDRSSPVIHIEARGHIEKYKRGTVQELQDFLREMGYVLDKQINHDAVYVPEPESAEERPEA